MDTGADSRAGEPAPNTSVRWYEPGDDEDLVEAMTASFDRWPRVETDATPLEHFRWKLSSDPLAPYMSIAGLAGSRVVHWHGYIVQRVRVEGRDLLSRQGVDTCTHPSFQKLNLGMQSRLMSRDSNRRDHHMIMGLQSRHPGIRRINERATGGARHRRELANRLEALLWTRKRHPWDAARLTLSRVLHHQGEPPIRAVNRFDERIDAFWEEACRPFALIVIRSQEHLNWRYADPRAGRFRIAIAEEGERLIGYIVTRASFGKGYVADLLALPGRDEVAEALIANGIASLRDEGAPTIECWVPQRHPYRAALRRQGFLQRRRFVRTTIRPQPDRRDDLPMPFRSDPNAPVHVMMGDFDLV